MEEACMAEMVPGNQLKQVYKTAIKFLEGKSGYEYLVNHLPKNLGFCTGLDFREAPLLLTAKNTAQFKKGMVFVFIVAFQDLELKEEDRASTLETSHVSSRLRLPVNDYGYRALTHSFLLVYFSGKTIIAVFAPNFGYGQHYGRLP
jgi:nucleosome binding factor SPN SPT16 subunit